MHYNGGDYLSMKMVANYMYLDLIVWTVQDPDHHCLQGPLLLTWIDID